MSAHDAAAIVLAQAPSSPDPGGQGEDFGKSSPVGLVLLIVFFIAVAFLVRSMSKHLRRLPKNFDEQRAAAAAPARAKRAERSAEPGTSEVDGSAVGDPGEGRASGERGDSDESSDPGGRENPDERENPGEHENSGERENSGNHQESGIRRESGDHQGSGDHQENGSPQAR